MPTKLTQHFTLEEMTFSQTAARDGIDNKPAALQIKALKALCVNLLEPIRITLAQSVMITSGFRSPKLNRAVGGAASSQHLEGKAADIVCPAMTPKALFKRVLAMNLPFDQIIYEGGRQSQWVHISYNGKKGRGEILEATFPESGGVQYRKLSRAEAARV